MLRRPGFRAKLALLTMAVSAAVLVAFAGVFWHLYSRSGERRLERDLAGLATRLVLSGQAWEGLDGHEEGGPLVLYGEEFAGRATLVEADGRGVVYRSPGWPEQLTPVQLPHLARTPHGHTDDDRLHRPPRRSPGPLLSRVELEGRPWRVASIRRGARTLHVALDLDRYRAAQLHVRGMLALGVGLGLLLSALGAWFVAGRALRPVRRLTEAAESITAADLGRRIPARDEDPEFERLVAMFNGMLERLDRSFRQAVRFSADASHELKTPLTILQGEVEQALRAAPEGSETQRSLASILDEVQRLKVLVRKLLLLSHADGGGLPLTTERVDLSALARDGGEDIAALGPDRRLDLAIDDGVEVQGDPALLAQLLQNLASNAVTHGEAGGLVRVLLHGAEGQAVFRIENSGPPIPARVRDRVFDRFFQVDESRSDGGVGLGLSLAREIARAHGGELSLEAGDGALTAFVLRLPLAEGGSPSGPLPS